MEDLVDASCSTDLVGSLNTQQNIERAVTTLTIRRTLAIAIRDNYDSYKPSEGSKPSELGGGNSKIFFFSPNTGEINDLIFFLIFFSNGVGKKTPPTREGLGFWNQVLQQVMMFVPVLPRLRPVD